MARRRVQGTGLKLVACRYWASSDFVLVLRTTLFATLGACDGVLFGARARGTGMVQSPFVGLRGPFKMVAPDFIIRTSFLPKMAWQL